MVTVRQLSVRFHFPVGFLFPAIVDNRFVNRFVTDSRENETKRFGLESCSRGGGG